MRFPKCPRCDLNYITDGKSEYCPICLLELGLVRPSAPERARNQAVAVTPSTRLASLRRNKTIASVDTTVQVAQAHKETIFERLVETDRKVMDGLKDFQRETTKRVAYLF